MMPEKQPQLDSGIEVTKTGAIVCTGDGIDTFRSLALYNGLILECVGLKLSRGISCQKIVKQEYGFKGNKFKLARQLGTRFIEYGFITQEKHDKNLEKIRRYEK
jgi:hypothetical protein